MNKQIFKQYIGYAGQVGIVLVSLYLLFAIAMDFYLYDIECSGGTDDASWTVLNEGWDYRDTIGLCLCGFYLLVTGTHLFLYFQRLSSKKKYNMWALPTFNIDGMRILSATLSVFFILFVVFFHTFIFNIMIHGDRSIDHFWVVLYIFFTWLGFTFFTSLHLFLYLIYHHEAQC